MNTITINGKTITVSGSADISVVNDQVFVNGEPEGETNVPGVVKIEIIGDPISVRSDRSIHVLGNVKGDVQAGESVNCRDVEGSVRSGGACSCRDVRGKVHAAGPISARHLS